MHASPFRGATPPNRCAPTSRESSGRRTGSPTRDDAEDESFATLELKINFLRPVWRATLTAEGVVVKRGGTVGLTECSVIDEKGHLVARASSTCLTLRGAQAAGR
ncbi:MAG: PaaI family thioesterase [Gemmatimonadaceae bacterium]